MKLLLFTLSLVITLLIGFFLVNLLNKDWSARHRFTLWAIIPGLGLAVTSLSFFLYRCIGDTAGSFPAYILFEALCLAVLGWLGYKKARLALPPFKLDVKRSPRLILVMVFAGALVIAVVQFWLVTSSIPYGSWDAWTIWNLHARFIFNGQGHWTDVFSPLLGWSHQDYPLLLPASIARLWSYLGSDNQLIPALIAFVYTFTSPILLGGALIDLDLTVQGILAAFVLVCTPFFIWNGAYQYADVPLSFYLCGAVILYYFYGVLEGRPRNLLFLMGGLVGAAAWIKNEGVSIFCSFLVVWVIFELVIKRAKLRPFLVTTAYWCLGALPFVLALLIFKIALAPGSEYFTPTSSAAIFPKITDLNRYSLIFHSIIAYGVSFGWWLFGIVPILLVFMLAIGFRRKPKNEWIASLGAAVLLAVILTSYFFVYVISPYPLEWHLAASLPRLLLQLYPAALFIIFSAIQDPFVRQAKPGQVANLARAKTY